MTSTDLALGALLVAAAAHACFQVVVSLLIYPRFRTIAPSQWSDHHQRHTRRITPLVFVIYVALLSSAGLAVLATPGLTTAIAAVAAGLAVTLTATVAAPLHSRLARGLDPRLLRRLQLVDLFRTVGAGVCLWAAVAALP